MTAWLPVLTMMTSLLPALIIFRIPEHRRGLRTFVNLAGAVAKLALVATMLGGVMAGRVYEGIKDLLPGRG